MLPDWNTDWVLYSFDPPLTLKGSKIKESPMIFPKGQCKKCQRLIGRGIVLHSKYCKG